MAIANQFLIGANDEHGMNPPTAGKRTPVMPYLDRSFYENEVNRRCKLYFLAGLSRCGFNVIDVHPEIEDTSVSERVVRTNLNKVDALVTFGYNAYGSGLSFNGVDGYLVFYSPRSKFPNDSKLLSVDENEGLTTLLTNQNLGVAPLTGVGVLQSVNCPSCLIEAGFMTNFNEAKLMFNPPFIEKVGEGACKGVCDYFNVKYVTIEANKPTLRRGNSSNYVRYLQYLLIIGGYSVTPDGIFGVNTQNAVRSFQEDVGIPVDGIVGKQTWNYITRNIQTYPTLRRGSRGAYVNFLQRLLTGFLYPTGIIDGVFGSATEMAVKDFQQENGLTADGIVGKLTWGALLSSLGRPMP